MIAGNHGQKAVVNQHVESLGQGIAPQMMRVSELPVEPFCVGIPVGQMSHNKEPARANDSVELFQGLGIDRDMFYHSASNDGVKRAVVIGQEIGMSQLRVLQAAELVKGTILEWFHVASVDFDFGSPEHTNHARVRSLPAAPIQDHVGVLEEVLATFENAGLSANHS
jgi:hypothetical protein